MKCKIENCEKDVTRPTLGWCESHYYRNRKYGDPLKSKRKNATDVVIRECDGYAVIELTNGGETKIDIEDIDKVSGYCWSMTSKKKLYARGYVDGKTLPLHRYIMDCPKGLCVDHINHDTLDNRKQNLRICTKQENHWNLRSRGGTSKYRGVSWCKSEKKWRACICKDGNNRLLGYFKNEKEAAVVYNREAKKLFGEFAAQAAIDTLGDELNVLLKN